MDTEKTNNSRLIDDNKWSFVSEILLDLQKQCDISNAATKNLMLAPESPLQNPFWQVVDATILCCSELTGDASENIAWFVYECDFGRKPMYAGFSDKMQKIDSHNMLRWLIELGDR